MRKITCIKNLLLSFVALMGLAVACECNNKVTQANFERVDYGMTRAQVEAILGKGQKTEVHKVTDVDNSRSIASYESEDAKQPCRIFLVYKDGKLTDKYFNGSQSIPRRNGPVEPFNPNQIVGPAGGVGGDGK